MPWWLPIQESKREKEKRLSLVYANSVSELSIGFLGNREAILSNHAQVVSYHVSWQSLLENPLGYQTWMPNHPDIHPESGSRVFKSSQTVFCLLLLFTVCVCVFRDLFFCVVNFFALLFGCCRSISSLLAGKRMGGASEQAPSWHTGCAFWRETFSPTMWN